MLKHVLFLLNNAGIWVPSLIQGTLCWGSNMQTEGKKKQLSCLSHPVKMLSQSTQRVCNRHDWCQHSLAFTMGQRVPILKRKRASFIHADANKINKQKKKSAWFGNSRVPFFFSMCAAGYLMKIVRDIMGHRCIA